MNDVEIEHFEKELGRLSPAPAPEQLVERTADALSRAQLRPEGAQTRDVHRLFPSSLNWLRWFAPFAAACALALVLVVRPSPAPKSRPLVDGSKGRLKADEVELASKLVTSFDAVAQLPSGEPLRLQCREWVDKVTLRDSARGVQIERREPRLEIVPVSFDTY